MMVCVLVGAAIGADASNNHQPKTTTGAISCARDAHAMLTARLNVTCFLALYHLTAILIFFGIKRKEKANKLSWRAKRRSEERARRGSSQKAQELKKSPLMVDLLVILLVGVV